MLGIGRREFITLLGGAAGVAAGGPRAAVQENPATLLPHVRSRYVAGDPICVL